MGYFSFADVRLAATYNLAIDESQIFRTPKKDYETVSVPGMNGSLIFSNNRFENLTIPVECFIRQDFPTNFRNLMNFLLSVDGYQKLIFPQDEGHFRMALFRVATEGQTGSFNKSGKVTIEFECKPQRFRDDGDSFIPYQTVSMSQVDSALVDTAAVGLEDYNTITNPTLFESKPLLRFYGNGTLTVNGTRVVVSGSSASNYIDIDCELMACYRGSANMGSYVSLPDGGYPVLKAGSNAVSYSSDTTNAITLRIKPRWWDL